VLLKVRAFLERLSNDTQFTEEDIQVWYSGTGYHVEMANLFGFKDDKNTAAFVRNTMMKMFPEGDDIYDKARLIRVGNTINDKSNLYKIPLTFHEVFNLSAADIMKLAQFPRLDFPLTDLNSVGGMEHLQQEILPQQEEKKQAVEAKTNFATCTQTMFQNGPQPGTRHHMILRIASTRRRGGAPVTSVIKELQDWCHTLPADEVERLVRSVYTVPYEFSCSDQLMTKYCSENCMFYRYKNLIGEFATAKKMEEDYAEFIRRDIAASSFDIKEIFHLVEPEYRFLPGELVVIIGDTKIGKTALAQNICTKMKRMKTLYVTMEVNQHLIYRRFVQIEHGMSKHDVDNHYRMNSNTLSTGLEHIMVVSTPTTVPEIFKIIKSVNPGIVVIDTTDGIRTKYRNDPTAASNEVALELRDLATATQSIVIAIHHIPKAALTDHLTGKPKALNVHSGKGSSTLEQKADKVLGLEVAPGKKLLVKSLAARDEGKFALLAEMDPDTFIFKEIANVKS
jgi:hypothetical protein